MGKSKQLGLSSRHCCLVPQQLWEMFTKKDEPEVPETRSLAIDKFCLPVGWDGHVLLYIFRLIFRWLGCERKPRNPQIALPGAGTWCIKIKRRRLRYMKLQKRRGCFKVRERLMLSLNWFMSCYSNVICIPLQIIFSIINIIDYFSTTLLWSKIKILVFQISNVKKLFFF